MFHNFILNAIVQASPTMISGVAFTSVSENTGQLPNVASKKNFPALNGSPPTSARTTPLTIKANTTDPNAPRIAALIDFESACRGSFLFDIMVCLEAWCYTAEFELDWCRAFLEGYESVRPLSPEERAAHVIEGSFVALRFATTRITDFSMRVAPGETPARDYRRFLARLDALECGTLLPVFAS